MAKRKTRKMRYCDGCGKELTRGQKRFCTHKCHGRWSSENRIGEKCPSWKGGRIVNVCEICGTQFAAYESENKRFCSPTCWGRWRSENLIGEDSPGWQGGKVERECEVCGTIFPVRKSRVEKGHGRFCSMDCYGRWLSKNRRGCNNPLWKRVTRFCEVCGNEFEVKKAVVKKGHGHYCSRDCYSTWQSENLRGSNNHNWSSVERNCRICDTTFYVNVYKAEHGHGIFCSQVCKSNWQSKNMRGENHPSWKGGISFEPYSPEFNASLKQSIRERDGYICAICCLWGNCVHHIDYDKKNHSPGNLITLCRPCHSTTVTNRDYWMSKLAAMIADKPAVFGLGNREQQEAVPVF